MTIPDAKAEAKAALESLVAECEREIRNISRFDDERMCVATGDIERLYLIVMDKAQQLAYAYRDALTAQEEG